VDLWRGELGLEAANAAQAAGEKIPVGDSMGTLYDLKGSKQGADARILGAVLQREGIAWFFKMGGSDALVAQQKSAFTDFLKSLSFVEGGAFASAHPSSATGGTEAAPGAPAKPAWEVPAHWQEQPPKTMVLAVFAVTADTGKAEVTVSAFPGDVGGLSRNVNRWRGQIGLGPVADAEVAKSTSPIQIHGQSGTLVDITNESNGSRISAILLPQSGMTWFFKMTGPNAVVAKEKPVFIKFVESVRFPGNA
jgi:hypothetical protein